MRDRWIQRLPSKATNVIVQSRPASRVSFIMPGERLRIKWYSSRRGLMKKWVDIPPLLYVWDVHIRNLRMFMVRTEAGKIHAQSMQIANVHPSGDICWGGERRPDNPLDAVASFWDSVFNDDLTQYQYPDTSLERYKVVSDYEPPEALRDLDRKINDEPGEELPSAWFLSYARHPAQVLRVELQAKIDYTQRRINMVTRMLDGEEGVAFDGMQYALQRQSSMGYMNVSLARRVHRLSALRDRLRSYILPWQEQIAAVERMCTTFVDLCYTAAEQHVQELGEKGESDYMRRWLQDSQRVQTIRTMPSGDRFIEHVRCEALLEAIKFWERRESEEGYTDWAYSEMDQAEEDWWDGGWQEFTEEEDLTTYLTGEERQFYDDGVYGVMLVTNDAANPIGRQMPAAAWIQRTRYVATVFRGNKPGMFLALAANIPFVGYERGSAVAWEPMDPKVKGLLQEIEEIFA